MTEKIEVIFKKKQKMQITNPYQLTVYLIILLNVILSLMAFGNIRLFESLKFRIGDILGNKEYHRLITSAFLHGDYFHLFINMYVLYSFSFFLQNFISIPKYLLIYFGSLIVGNLLPLFIHKNETNYSALWKDWFHINFIQSKKVLWR